MNGNLLLGSEVVYVMYVCMNAELKALKRRLHLYFKQSSKFFGKH